ncbi:MAG: aldehyde dehydrogenase [Proteobacteria bacterium]|nr:aldehyde dehydrogenase [Pseudomonadota bacterium]
MRIGINGFGRIGRAITRIIVENKSLDIVAINDINPDPSNLAYLLKYDTTYGRLSEKIWADERKLYINNETEIALYSQEDVTKVPWDKHGVDFVIDASGVKSCLQKLHSLQNLGVKRCVVTNSPEDSNIKSIVMGVNEKTINLDDYILSSSICDANAFVPVMNLLQENFGVDHGFVTTLHPWLGYQNLLDGPSMSVSDPGHIHSTYVLGRSSINALIPKTTTCISASCRALPWLDGKFMSLSYRVPTMIVSSADISVKLEKNVTREEIKRVFENAEQIQQYKIIKNVNEPLTSIDFTGSEYSAIVDHRWLMVNGHSYCKFILWYDNEWGYSSRVIDLVHYLGTL